MTAKRGDILRALGLSEVNSGAYAGGWIDAPSGPELISLDPATGEPIARVLQAGRADYERAIETSERAFADWRLLPAPRRGEIVRRIGDELRRQKEPLGALVTWEMGKIRAEGLGEVQEMIDLAEFAVGLSRQLYGLTMHSERPGHRMYEQWHPLGVVGCITAFNFPVAVWSWNSLIAAVCGDTVVWKPSPVTPLCAIAVQKIVEPVLREAGFPALFNLTMGTVEDVGEPMIHDRRVPLISATGSCGMGRHVGQVVAGRLGRSLLELGGNNAILVLPDADLELALRGIVFGAVGTAGQRCTTTRRVFLHREIEAAFTERLLAVYRSVEIGDPLEDGVLMGPLVNEDAVHRYLRALEEIKEQGGEILYGGKRLDRPGNFVQPTLVRARADMPIVAEETFAPILYLLPFSELDDAIAQQNGVTQGLSSAVFTRSVQTAELFLSARGSDCGIANVNIGTSGAEIGGAFGGEKETGGGRESGSDSWKAYMRRQTCTINYSNSLPLAQGIEFGV